MPETLIYVSSMYLSIFHFNDAFCELRYSHDLYTDAIFIYSYVILIKLFSYHNLRYSDVNSKKGGIVIQFKQNQPFHINFDLPIKYYKK